MSRIALFLPNLEGGGAERAYVELANRFVVRGHDVEFVLASAHGPYRSELSSLVKVVDLGGPCWLSLPGKLARYLRAARPDVLLSGLDVTNAVAAVATQLDGCRTRCVISQRNVIRSVWQLEHPLSWPFWLWLLRRTYRRVDLVICNSSAAATEVIDDLGVPAERCAIVLNPVDMARISGLAAEPTQHPWLDEWAPPLLLSVGSFTPRKDTGTLVRAFAQLRRERACNLLLLGDGHERPMLESLVHELGVQDSVRMPGFVKNPFPWIARADVILSASLAEGCPNVLQQALALGTSIVATDCLGGTAEVLEQGRWGKLVPVSDPDSMADAIRAALDQPELTDGRVRARTFDLALTVDRYLDLLLSPIGAQSTPMPTAAPSANRNA